MGAINMFNDFVKLIESESLPVEAVAIADGDAIIAERHFVPDQDRNIYSHTKSYVSTAIGIAMACCRSIRDWSTRSPSMFPPMRNWSWARSR